MLWKSIVDRKQLGTRGRASIDKHRQIRYIRGKGLNLRRSVRSVKPGWKLRAAGDYVDRRKNKLRIGLSTRLHRHLPHLLAVAGAAATVYHKVYNFCQAPWLL